MAIGPWKIEIQLRALRELDQLEDSIREEAVGVILDLKDDPFPPDALRLRGHRNRFRLKFYGNRYRIIYQISEQQRTIIVTRVRRRDPHTYSGY